MRPQALVLACFLVAGVLCQSAVASPASIAGELVMSGIVLHRPMVEKFNHSVTVNQTVVQQRPAASDGIGHRLHQNWFSLLSELTSPLARDRSLVRPGIEIDHLLVLLAAFVVYLFR